MDSTLSSLQDPARLSALHETALLDSPPEDRFDQITRLASDLLNAPISLLTLVDDHRQFIVSGAGLTEPLASTRQTPLSHSICKHVVASGAPLLIENVEQTPLVRGSPAVQELDIAAYAGYPLRIDGGHVAGDLCVIDHVPRAWLPGELELLENLSAMAQGDIDQRLQLLRLRRTVSGAQKRLEKILAATPAFRTLVESTMVGIAAIDDAGFWYVNPRFAEIFGYSEEEILTIRPEQLAVEEDRPTVAANLHRRLSGETRTLRYSFRGRRRDGRVIRLEVEGTRTDLDGRPLIVGTLLDVTEQVESQRALRRREEHFRALIESTWNIVHTVDSRGVIRYVSPSVERVLGFSPQELVGRHAGELVHPQDMDKARQTLEQALSDPGTTQFLELRLRHRDGSIRTVETAGTVIDDGAVAPLAIVHTQDITERERVERALRESEERYRMVIRATQSAVWDWHVPTGEVLWNGSSYDLLRHRHGALESSIAWWYAQLHPADQQDVVGALDSALHSGSQDWTYEHRFRRGDGTYATVLNCCTIMRDEDGRAVRVIGSMSDISERKRQEETQRFLAQASALLHELQDPEIIFANLARLVVPALADCCLIHVVRTRGELHRVAVAHADPAQERLLRDDDPVAAKPHRPPRPVARVVRSGKSLLVPELDAEAARAGSWWEDLHASELSPGIRSLLIVPLTAHDRVLGAITLANAQSERHFGPRDLMLAEDLAHRAGLVIDHARLFHEAQEAIDLRDEVLGVVSHDLRNPLNTIQLATGFMLEQAEERRTENVEQLELIQRVTSHMSRMVQDLLDVSSILAGRFALEPVEHDVASLIAEAEALLRPLAEHKDVSLQCTAEEHLAPTRIDAHRVLRVISNLVGNAIKFTPEGGTVTLRAERAGHEVRFTVTDTGPGIPREYLPHVFDRYWQARSGDRRGAGLGLAIAKGIVEAHGGRIWAESPPDRGGAVFVFTVPAVSPQS